MGNLKVISGKFEESDVYGGKFKRRNLRAI